MSQSFNEAEKMLIHIIEHQPDLFKQRDSTPMSAENIALFCATFINEYSGYCADIKNNRFPPRQP